MGQRTLAQNEAFRLRKMGIKATRIVKTVEDGHDKNNKPILTKVLTSFGYSKDTSVPREINETEIGNYNFEFIYYN